MFPAFAARDATLARLMLLALLGALVVGLSLGLTGSGGSILAVPVLRYILGHPEKLAIAESLGIVAGIAAAGAIPYARQKLVIWPAVLFFGIPGMAGTYFGAWLSHFVSGTLQLLVFGGVMLVAAFFMWRPRREAAIDERPAPRPLLLTPPGVGAGVLTGFVGVGGGFMIVPALVLLGGIPMRLAVGTSLVIIALQAATGFAKHGYAMHVQQQSLDWTVIGVFIVVGVFGTLIGKRLNAANDPHALRRGFAVLLVVIAVFILISESGLVDGA